MLFSINFIYLNMLTLKFTLATHFTLFGTHITKTWESCDLLKKLNTLSLSLSTTVDQER